MAKAAKNSNKQIDWGAIHLVFNGKTRGIAFGLATGNKQDGMAFGIKSGDRTEECISVLARFFKKKMEKKDEELVRNGEQPRHFFGYDVYGGKLVYIESGYGFDVLSPIQLEARNNTNN